MGLFSKKIEVEFIDALDGSVIGASKLPLDQLPDTFEIATTMDLGNDKWTIASATPATKSEFSKSKSLILTMNKVEMINPNDILFSLPTISSELPNLTQNATFNESNFNLREDDWRQLEFLPKSSLNNIETERSFIKDIWDNHSKAIDKTFNTFSKLHVRNSIGVPLVQVSLEQLQSALKISKVDDLTLGEAANFVENGFAITMDSCAVYGTTQNGMVESLGVDRVNADSEKVIQIINSTFNLIFVNWYYYQITD